MSGQSEYNAIQQKRQALKHSQMLAQYLQGMGGGQDPNQTVGSGVNERVVPVNPLGALMDMGTKGLGLWQQKKAIDAEAALGREQQSTMAKILSSGKQPSMAELASSGMVEPSQLAEALLRQGSQGNDYVFMPTQDGKIFGFDKRSGQQLDTGKSSPLYDLPSVYQRQGTTESVKGGSYVDAEGRTRYGSAAERNPYYRQFVPGGQQSPMLGGTQSYDYPTGFMGNQGSGERPKPGVYDATPEEIAAVEGKLKQAGVDTGQPYIFNAAPQPSGGAVSPTPGQVEAQKQNAVFDIEARKKALYDEMDLEKAARQSDIEGRGKVAQQQRLDQYTRSKDANEAIGIINEARALLPGSTGSGIGAWADSTANLFGYTLPGAANAARLKALGGALVAKMPKMAGPQSDKDVLLYKEAAGQVGDPTIPVEQRLAALDTVLRLQQQYAGGSVAPATTQPKPMGGGVKFLGFE